MPQPPADFGTPTDGPLWTCVGVYEDGMQAAIFHVHAPHVSGVLDTIDHAIRADRAGAVYAIVAACVPEDDHDLARLFADNLDTLATTDYDAQEVMEADDGIHLCRGIRYALTMHLFALADSWVRPGSSRSAGRRTGLRSNGASARPV